MKKIRVIMIFIFFFLLFLPVIAFNCEENVVSVIDNRELTNNPFGENYKREDGVYLDITKSLESYVQDRIGFRDEMILAYTVMNDKLFQKMIHPSYDYGKDGYVFRKASSKKAFTEYHEDFAQMVKEIQTYCEERNVPFVFMFNPEKASVLADKLRAGITWDTEWVSLLFERLDELGVNYVDNTELLKEKTQQGEVVFNQKYNAGHWNDLGAFYGCNAVVENLKLYNPAIHVNSLDEYNIEQILNTSLPTSMFPIKEYEPIFELKTPTKDVADNYSEVKLHEQFPTSYCFENQQRKEENAPSALVFQGSYMNGMGYKFLQNSFSEYVSIHDYQNVIDFDYYFNIFQPDCVIFETAEYTITSTYYDEQRMKEMDLNPKLDDSDVEVDTLTAEMVKVKKGKQLIEINVENLPEDVKYAYVKINETVFDLKKSENQYQATIEAAAYNAEALEVIVEKTNGSKIAYR